MRNILIVIGIIFLIIVAYALLKKGANSIKSETPVTQTETQRYVAAEGKVEAIPGYEVEVGSELPGRIERFYIKEGEWIKKGELIAKINNRDIESKRKEAEGELEVVKAKLKEVASGSREEEIRRAAATYEASLANLELTKKNLERYETLYKEGVIPKSLLEEKVSAFKIAMARAREAEEEKRIIEKGPKTETIKLLEDTVKRTEATVEYFKNLLEKSYIASPISGKVIHKYLEEGEMVIEEVPLAAIADVEKIRINAEVDETDTDMVHIGDPVEIKSDAFPGRFFTGSISEIADYVGKREIRPNDPVKNLDVKVIQVKIGLHEKTPFKIGMTVDVRIKSKPQK